MGKITFESDNPADVDAFEEHMVEAMMDCRIGVTGRCAIEGTDECDQCPFSGELRSKQRHALAQAEDKHEQDQG